MQKYLDLMEEKDYTKLEEPAKIIRNGGVVIIPTETVYGIGANAFDKKAVKKIYDIKKRSNDKPISLLVSDIDMINEIAENISDIEYKLMEEFFPGPLTIILKKKECVPDFVTSNQKTVGVRMPDSKIALELIKYVGAPIATSSANISGKPSEIHLKNIMKEFGENVDYYIDGGKSKIGVSSTLVQVINGIPHILRKGSITKDEIEKTIGKVVIEN